MKALVSFVLITIVTFALALMYYLGAFKPVEITFEERGPYHLVYKKHLGAYHKIVPTIEEVERWGAKNNEGCMTTFGEYIDDPKIVDEDRLNSHGGCIVGKSYEGLPEGFIYREQARRSFVTARFEGAPSIGPQKVYPKAESLIKELGMIKDGPVIELYEMVDGKKLVTHYLFPVKKQTP